MTQAPTVSRTKSKAAANDSCVFISMLHQAAARGDLRKVKKILKTGVDIDQPSANGQTALFMACFEGHRRLTKILLANGANPNYRNIDGSTPVHAASFICDRKLVGHLIDAGGDLRLHDYSGRNPRDWAMQQPDGKKRKSFLDFLLETRSLALFNYGTIPLNKLSSLYSAFQRFQKRQKHFQKRLFSTNHNFGYGFVFQGHFGCHCAFHGNIPMIPESNLKHDNAGPTYNNGPFMVMESMVWKNVPVTVKRLHRALSVEEASVDLLIKELECVSCLQHPNILLLMAVCMNNSMEGLVLLYEKVRGGSLDTLLYQRGQSLVERDIYKIFYQISNAMVYLHQRGIIHCCLTPHAIQLVLPTYAKLSNFEYSRESIAKKQEKGQALQTHLDGKLIPKFAYNWLSPEFLSGQQILTEQSDVYSLCCILWEVLHGNPPWYGRQAEDIVVEIVTNKASLPVGGMNPPFVDLLSPGLNLDPSDRGNMNNFREVMWQGLRRNVDLSEHQLDVHVSQYSSPELSPFNAICVNLPLPETLPETMVVDPKPAEDGIVEPLAEIPSTGMDCPGVDPVRSESKDSDRQPETTVSAQPQPLKKTESLVKSSEDTRKLGAIADPLDICTELDKPGVSQSKSAISNRHSCDADDPGKFRASIPEGGSRVDQNSLITAGIVGRTNIDRDETDNLLHIDCRPPIEKFAADKYGSSAGENLLRDKLPQVEAQMTDVGNTGVIGSHSAEGKSFMTNQNQVVYNIHEISQQHVYTLGDLRSPNLKDKEPGNPFHDEQLRYQSEELCRQLLNKPLPQLSMHQQLISKPEFGDSAQRRTVYGSLIREYSQNQSTAVHTKHRSLGPPTFGICLQELKAVVASRAATGRAGTRSQQFGNYTRPSYGGPSKTDQVTEPKTCSFKPASHCEPSLNFSPSKNSFHHLQNFSIPPCISNSSTLNINCCEDSVDTWSAAGAEKQHKTFPRSSTTIYKAVASKHYDYPDRRETEVDSMARFKSDPLLQTKLELKKFHDGNQSFYAKSATNQQNSYMRETAASQELDEDENLEELIGSYHRTQNFPVQSHWVKPSQLRFTSDSIRRCVVRSGDPRKSMQRDDNTQTDEATDHCQCVLCERDVPSEISRSIPSRQSLAETRDSKVQVGSSGIDGQKIQIHTDMSMEQKQPASASGSAANEDFYFDDVLDSNTLFREKHMRLQSTMTLDSSCSAMRCPLSGLNSPAVDMQRSRASASSRPATGPRQPAMGKQMMLLAQSGRDVPSNVRSYHSGVNDSRRMVKHFDKESDIIVETNMTPVITSMSSVTVESDTQGHHIIHLKRINPHTGTESTTYKASVLGEQVVTQVFLPGRDNESQGADNRRDLDNSRDEASSRDEGESAVRVSSENEDDHYDGITSSEENYFTSDSEKPHLA